MWFKVVFNKDGSVSACDSVDGSIREDGKHVIYVEADTKEEALSKGRNAFLLRVRARAAENKALGKCRCGTELTSGMAYCDRCRARHNLAAKNCRQRKKEGRMLTDEQRRALSSESAKKLLAKGRATVAAQQQKPLETLSAHPKNCARRAMEQARDAFWRLSGPAFAAWLDERIVALGGEARPKAAE